MDESSGSTRRRTRAALKELLLDAGTEILRDEGTGVGTTSLTYQRVFAHLEATQGIRVTRGSVHERIWASQRDFQLDVLRRAARWDPSESNEVTLDAIAAVLDTADLVTDDGRRRTLKELWRVAGPANLAAAEERDHWSSWIGIALALSGSRLDDSDERSALLATVADTYTRLTDRQMDINEAPAALLHSVPRADLFPAGFDAARFLTMLATALADGVALRQQLTDDLREIQLATGPQGALETWHPFSVGMWAISSFLTELVERPADEISLYLDSTRETRSVLTNPELARLRACESTDNYEAVSRSGAYRGAYQFDQATWDDVSGRFFPWLTGLDPATVEPWWQDAMTRALWSERGRQPWPICGHRV